MIVTKSVLINLASNRSCCRLSNVLDKFINNAPDFPLCQDASSTSQHK